MNDSKYIPLTKKIIDGNKEKIALLIGTNKCQIHNGIVTIDEKTFNALIKQLNVFEEVYMNM